MSGATEDAVQAIADYFPLSPIKHGIYKWLLRKNKPGETKDCKTNDGEPATVELIEQHLRLNGTRLAGGHAALGYIPAILTSDGELLTNTGTVDVDGKAYVGHEPDRMEQDRLRLRDVVEARGGHAYFERSSRGNGWHVHVFLETAIPLELMSRILRGWAKAAGVVKAESVETYPHNENASGHWLILPYAKAGEDPNRLGVTYLETADGTPIPFDELPDWIERTPNELLEPMAEPETVQEAEEQGGAGGLSSDSFEAFKEALLNPGEGFERHGSIIAALNIAERMGERPEMLTFLKSDELRAAWVKDGSRNAREWKAEVERWGKAKPGSRRYGFPFLKAQGFKIPSFETVKRPLHTFKDTDLGNAERLVAWHGEDIRYNQAIGWIAWDGKRWNTDGDGAAIRRAKQTIRAGYLELAEIKEDSRRAAFAVFLARSESRAAIANMVELAKTEPDVQVALETFDNSPYLLNCLNGTIDLRTGGLHPHTREDYITQLCPVEYNSEAKCPTWEAFQEKICKGDQELIFYKQKMLGYALTGLNTEQVLVIRHGNGANGKSTEAEVERAMLGEYAKHTDFSTFETQRKDSVRNDLARLRGARLVTAVESERGAALSEGLVKQLTGGDTILARFLHKEYFEFTPTFAVFLATNHKPTIRGTDHGIWRRVRLIPYDVTIPAGKQDKHLTTKLKAELPGILAWAVRGCLAWFYQGLTPPECVREATANYESEMDALADFIAESFDKGDKLEVGKSELRELYLKHCEKNKNYAMSTTKLTQALLERGYTVRKSGANRFWKGLGLKTEKGAGASPQAGTAEAGFSSSRNPN